MSQFIVWENLSILNLALLGVKALKRLHSLKYRRCVPLSRFRFSFVHAADETIERELLSHITEGVCRPFKVSDPNSAWAPSKERRQVVLLS